jgi:serine protease Do
MLMRAFNTPSQEGVLVSAVTDDGNAALQGQIKPGDVVLSFNGQAVKDPRDLARKAAQASIGSDATLELYRNGGRQVIHVTIQAWPEANPDLAPSSPQKLGVELAVGRRDSGEADVVVASVDPTGTAAESGLQKGDIVLEVQQIPIADPAQALRVLEDQAAQKHPFAAVLVEHAQKRIWIPLALPD